MTTTHDHSKSTWTRVGPWRRKWLRGFHSWAHTQLMAVPLGDFEGEGYWYGVRLAALFASDPAYKRYNRRSPLGAIYALGDYDSVDEAFLRDWVNDDKAHAGFLDGVAVVHRIAELRSRPAEGYADLLTKPWDPTLNGLSFVTSSLTSSTEASS